MYLVTDLTTTNGGALVDVDGNHGNLSFECITWCTSRAAGRMAIMYQKEIVRREPQHTRFFYKNQ